MAKRLFDHDELLESLGLAKSHERRDFDSIMHGKENQSMIRPYESSYQDSAWNYSTNDERNVESNSGRGKFMFSMTVDLTDDIRDQILVYENDNPFNLATEFCQKHRLQQSLIDVIGQQIVDNAKAYIEEQNDNSVAHPTDESPKVRNFFTLNDESGINQTEGQLNISGEGTETFSGKRKLL